MWKVNAVARALLRRDERRDHLHARRKGGMVGRKRFPYELGRVRLRLNRQHVAAMRGSEERKVSDICADINHGSPHAVVSEACAVAQYAVEMPRFLRSKAAQRRNRAADFCGTG